MDALKVFKLPVCLAQSAPGRAAKGPVSMLEQRTEARRRLAQRYNELLAAFGEVPQERPGEYYVFQTYVFKCDRRDALQQYLRDNGVEAIVHYRTLIHEQPAAGTLGCPLEFLPRARRHADRILSLPIYPGLARGQQDRVVSLIGQFPGRRAA